MIPILVQNVAVLTSPKFAPRPWSEAWEDSCFAKEIRGGRYNFSVTMRGTQGSDSCSLAAIPFVSVLFLGFLFSQACPSLYYLSVTEQVSFL